MFSPTSFRLNLAAQHDFSASSSSALLQHQMSSTYGAGGGHPSLGNLGLLVFEAVLEVVCVSLPGYIIARAGMFGTENQKFVANLNVSLFTPCLIFTKLASQLTLSKFAELAIIPVIFVFMTAVSWLCSVAVAKAFGLEKRAKNFVIAMGVFCNSNSLPISLVISLSHTISGLHWDRIENDTDGEVAARGILYLLIFQQLGQLLRWTWGFNVLLAPVPDVEEPEERYRDNIEGPSDDEIDTPEDLEAGTRPLAAAARKQHLRVDPFMSPRFENSFEGLHKIAAQQAQLQNEAVQTKLTTGRHHNRMPTDGTSDSAFESAPVSGNETPISFTASESTEPSSATTGDVTPTPASLAKKTNLQKLTPRWMRGPSRSKTILTRIIAFFNRLITAFLSFMNPPLWAMLAAVIVASIPALQTLFFKKGTFIEASITRAVSQNGNVAVPLILVVLGANLANNTQSRGSSARQEAHESRLVIASVLSRMVLPFIVMAPVLAVAAKYLNISILDDPIFVVVCFLLTGAPSALQLAQICQLNGIYEDVMGRLLFWSYVIVILPSTLVLVITAIEVVHWAT